MYFELPHGDSTMQLAGYIGRIIPIPNWDWSEVSHWLASHEIPMKCPWNPIYIYIIIYIYIGWLLPWNPNMFPMYFPCVFPRITWCVFSHPDAEIAGGFSMLRASPGASVWPCASGGTSIMALRLGLGGKTAMGPWAHGRETGDCRLKRHDLPENCVVFRCSTYLLMFLLVCLQERKH